MLSRHKFALLMTFSVSVRCSCNSSRSKNDSYSSLARPSSLSASSIFTASSHNFLQLPRDFRRFLATFICLVGVAFWRDNFLLAFSFRKFQLSERLSQLNTTTRISYSSTYCTWSSSWSNFNSQTPETLHIKRKFIIANVQCYVSAISLCHQMFRTISRCFKTTKR